VVLSRSYSAHGFEPIVFEPIVFGPWLSPMVLSRSYSACGCEPIVFGPRFGADRIRADRIWPMVEPIVYEPIVFGFEPRVFYLELYNIVLCIVLGPCFWAPVLYVEPIA
jgi:hypothetical protein